MIGNPHGPATVSPDPSVGTSGQRLTIDPPHTTLFGVIVFQGVFDEISEVHRRWLLCPAIVA